MQALAVTDYLRETRQYYAAYHNHKEQMAYAGTALYLAALTAVALSPGTMWLPSIRTLLYAKGVVALAVVGFAFVGWQLRNREYAANIIQACGDELTRALSPQHGYLDLTPTKVGYHAFPAFLAERVRGIDAGRLWLEGPRVSEAITYLVMLIWFVVALVRVVA